MERVNRELLLQQLESVQPGLSPREIVEQSSCFVFMDGKVVTYNDEVACSHDCVLKMEGAVQADPLLKILRKSVDDELELRQTSGELRLTGKRSKTGIAMEKEIQLPISSVEYPKKWRRLPDDFSDAIQIVQSCASTDESAFNITCVHLHPKWIEAADNYQLTRYWIAMGIESEVLVRSSSIKHIVSLGMSEFGETESWMHFRNGDGLVLSCRRYEEQFPNLSKFLKAEGEPATLPKGLADAVEAAGYFTEENADNQVTVELRPGKLRVHGKGVSGWHTAYRKFAYSGPRLSFMIAPQLLIEISKRYNECFIGAERLKVEGERFTYVTCLEAPGAKEPVEEAVEETADA